MPGRPYCKPGKISDNYNRRAKSETYEMKHCSHNINDFCCSTNRLVIHVFCCRKYFLKIQSTVLKKSGFIFHMFCGRHEPNYPSVQIVLDNVPWLVINPCRWQIRDATEWLYTGRRTARPWNTIVLTIKWQCTFPVRKNSFCIWLKYILQNTQKSHTHTIAEIDNDNNGRFEHNSLTFECFQENAYQ